MSEWMTKADLIRLRQPYPSAPHVSERQMAMRKIDEHFTPKTREQIKADFAALGITLSQWARENGFDRTTVYAVINGYSRCSYGSAHAIAVALGMKAPPDALPFTASGVDGQFRP